MAVVSHLQIYMKFRKIKIPNLLWESWLGKL